MCHGAIAVLANSASTDSFSVEDLYELQRRRGKLKPPAVSYQQRTELKNKLGRQNSLDCSLIRSVQHVFRDFGSVSTWLMWHPAEGFTAGWKWMVYSFFGSPAVDNVVSGRTRMSRLRPLYQKQPGTVLQVNRLYDPYRAAQT